MGLGFTIHTKIKDIEKFQQTVESQAVESGYNAEHDESSSTVSFCRLGDLFLNYQHEGEGNTDNVISVNGDCQTNMLGPGFHKAAIEFIDRYSTGRPVPGLRLKTRRTITRKGTLRP